MSVVNQMLKDLDRRQGADQTVYRQHIQPSGPSPWLKIGIAIGLVSICGLIATIFFLLPHSDPSTQTKNDIAAPNTSAPIVIAPVAVPAASEAVAPPVQIVETHPPETKTEAPIVPPLAVAVEPRPPRAKVPVVAQEVRSEPAIEHEPASAPVAPPVPAKTVESTLKAFPATSGPAKIDVHPTAVAQTAEGEFRRAVALLNQGRAAEARASLTNALKIDPRHEGARQTLAVLLIETQANDAAEAVLEEGLRLNPNQFNFAVVSARLKMGRDDTLGALNVLREHGAAAANNPEYRAFTAALLERLGRHAEAIEEYRAAVALAPAAGVWWMGLGISYEAAGQSREAIDAFKHAQAGKLPPELADFVERKLQTIR